MTAFSYSDGTKITESMVKIARAIEKIANAYAEKTTPATYNIYVNTSGEQTAEDIAAAVQATINRPK